jgi:pimeloyl-ACP methyl ester carboxylesterase
VASFVLVHGAFHDGSAWDAVVERLTACGHTAYAPTVAGHGKGVRKDVSHKQCVQSIVDYVVDRDLFDLILVGHSFGATVTCKVAEAVPERIRRLVFYAGILLQDGESVYEASAPGQRPILDQLVAESPDGSFMPPFEIFRDAFIGDADLDTARRAYEQLAPQPAKTFFDHIDLKRFYSLSTPRSYLLGTEDCAMLHADWPIHPRMTSRLGVFRFLQMPGGHELMFSNPVGLADKIVEAARD